jgi:hypothetical protein
MLIRSPPEEEGVLMKISALHFTRAAAILSILLFAIAAATAQPAASIAGDYVGTLGPLHLKLHLKSDSAGELTGTLDSPDQGAVGLPCADIRLEGSALSFTVPSVHGSWTGTVGLTGVLAGTWDQGSAVPLNFKRDTFVPATKRSALDGTWLGTLHAGPQNLRLQLNVKSDASGHLYCTLDSLDQHAMGLECDSITANGRHFSFQVPSVHGDFTGTLSADSKSISGTWSQGASLPLTFTRR